MKYELKIVLDKEKLLELLKVEGMSVFDLYEVWNIKYEFDLSYKTFNKLVNNKIVWKMSYGIALTELLSVRISDIFKWG